MPARSCARASSSLDDSVHGEDWRVIYVHNQFSIHADRDVIAEPRQYTHNEGPVPHDGAARGTERLSVAEMLIFVKDDTLFQIDGVGGQISCLPAEISAYRDSPYTSPPIPENEMETRVAELRATLPQLDVTTFFKELSDLGSIGFTYRRLSLPCITFSVSINTTGHAEGVSVSEQGTVCHGQAVVSSQLKLSTSCTTLMAQDEVVLVYPWIRDLLTQANRPEWDDYTRALRLVVHLEQPFRALLLVKQPAGTYKRVAADREILVPPRKVSSLKDIGAKVLEIR
ncbi:hypothetical protein EDD15DRAFT_2201419 [Pisolithus albus]|nr:hypothetical protein EDD15DRAFT_2201419 [Pisolithus albus]